MKILTELLKLYGTAEVGGAKSNPDLIAILRKHYKQATDDSTTAWCGIMMAEAFTRAGESDLVPDLFMAARSWLSLPNPVELDKAELGDIVIFWRGTPEGWSGHVAVYVNQIGENVFVCGGNQGDRVSIAPYAKARILGIRKAPK